jgi:hypothetical protein
MTAKAALCLAFLQHKVLNIRTCFKIVGLSNLPREAKRMVEDPFNVSLKRVHQVGESRYGTPSSWVDYSLPYSKENKEGIEKMRIYVQEQMAKGKEINKKDSNKEIILFQ